MSNWISPTNYTSFEVEETAMSWCKEWGLLTDKAARQKTYKYRNKQLDIACEIVGYVDDYTAVIQVNDHLHCIHPSYLKELQSARFAISEVLEFDEKDTLDEQKIQTVKTVLKVQDGPATQDAPKKPAQKAAKKPSLALPEGKVKFVATLESFASVPNHFSDEDDEVIVFEQVSFQSETETIELESAWSSHSNTLKKLALQPGDQLNFEAKIVAKKLTRHPVKYKLNNIAKVVKKDHA